MQKFPARTDSRRELFLKHTRLLLIALPLAAAVVVAVAIGGFAKEAPYESKPLRLVDAGSARFGSWKVLLGQSAQEGPYLRLKHAGGSFGFVPHEDGGIFRGLSLIDVDDGTPAMVYGAVDDAVSGVMLRFDDGRSQDLALFNLEDVTFFYGLVPTERRTSAIVALDAWKEQVGILSCEISEGLAAQSTLGNGCI